MSNMLESLANPQHKDQLEERMARIREDPSLKHILEEIETGGPAAMMRYYVKQITVTFSLLDNVCGFSCYSGCKLAFLAQVLE